MGRQLVWTTRWAGAETATWRARAALIPDPARRCDALSALLHKRSSIEGASLFSALHPRRDRTLVALLVAYEVLADYLDEVNERPSEASIVRGRRLQAALIDALRLEVPVSCSYYRSAAAAIDAGYLDALIAFCRASFASCPSAARVASTITDAVELTRVLCLNHEPDPARRLDALRSWAQEHRVAEQELQWFESPAAASTWLAVLALLAVAADPRCDGQVPRDVYAAYYPWVSLLGTLLDSYADLPGDLAGGRPSYTAFYQDRAAFERRLVSIAGRAMREVGGLRDGAKHQVIVASMIAMFLASAECRDSVHEVEVREVLAAGGWLTRAVMPAVRVWVALHTDACSPRRKPFIEWPAPSRWHRGGSGDPKNALPSDSRLPVTVQTALAWRFPLAVFDRAYQRHGATFTLRLLGQPPFVLFSDRDDIAAILKAPADTLHPGAGARVLTPVIGERSFMLLGEPAHMAERKRLTQAMPWLDGSTREQDEALAQIVSDEVCSWPVGGAVALEPHLRSLALRIVLTNVFGMDGKAVALLHRRLLAMLAGLPTVLLQEPFLRGLPGCRTIWSAFVRRREDVDRLIYAYLEERLRARHQPGGMIDEMLSSHTSHGSADILRHTRDNIMTMIIAGHETTAAALAWAFTLLAHHADARERLLAEVDEESSTEYMTATIREVLRHRPVFPFTIPRQVRQEIELGGRIYRPPVHLLCCIYLAHHDPNVYPAPQDFRPERFLAGAPAPYTWLPWGGGHRRCPGHHLATAEMETVLRAALRRFAVAPAGTRVEGPRWRGAVVTPRAGGRVYLQRRDRMRRSLRAPRHTQQLVS